MKQNRTLKVALGSFLANLAYALYNGYIGLANGSWWFVTACAYYTVLSVMRFAVLKTANRGKDGRWVMRFTGGMFLFLAIVLAGTAYLAVEVEEGIRHGEIVMITMAAYAFTKITLAIIKLVKAGRLNAPVIKTLRSISLADGLVSIFSLQRSMLVSFEGMSAGGIQLMNLLTGTGVYLIVAILGIDLIGGKKIEMAKSKIVRTNEKIADGVVSGYKKIERGVVDGYKKIERGVVDGYTKLEDKFVEKYLTRDGETVEEAKERLKKTDDKEE